MIQQEEFQIKGFSTGVTFYIFSDTIYNNLSENPDEYSGPFPSYVVFNLQNEIYSLNYFNGDTIWSRNENNNYIPIDEVGWNYKTGYTLVKTIESNLSQENIENTKNLILSRLSDPNRLGTPPSASAATNYVFYKKKLLEDFYVDLKIERSYNSLDTLKIYNNTVNTIPTRNSETGVVFGKLTAIQKIKDENGENIKIPLKNVPIGIFNPSEDFPQVFSKDEDGNRIYLNLKESSTANQSDYFNSLSYQQDIDFFLKSGESFSGIPNQYKYITTTNENGEYIIYDVPIGEQVLLFEVDLFKQGLTKDEIALNFFPFPSTENSNLDSLPSFYFRQVPITIVPSWGVSQTGYTNLDINVNLDLRKWVTYMLPPVSYDAEKLEATVSKDNSRTLKVEVRDMTVPSFEKKPLEIVQIFNDLDRDFGSEYLWFEEFAQRRNVIEFSKFGCNIFKLPANLYDPTGFRTNRNGLTTSNKGVWLAAYQIKASIGSVERTTGTIRAWNGTDIFTKSHFYVNYSPGVSDISPSPSEGEGIGLFPYEKPWSIEYPNKYSIPKKPTNLRITDSSQRLTRNNGAFYIKEPMYSDGDLVGVEFIGDNGEIVSGGFGLQNQGNYFIYNRIANVATRNFMYKYENGVSWNEKYANGFEYYWTQETRPGDPLAGLSDVVNGEKYQRLECGYGYFLKPEGWGRIVRLSNGVDINLDTSLLSSSSNSGNPGPINIPPGDINLFGNKWYCDEEVNLTMFNLDNQNLTLALNRNSSIKKGSLSIYRIIESGLDNIKEFTPIVIPTFTTLRIEGSIAALAMTIKNIGETNVEFTNNLNQTSVENNGIIKFKNISGDLVDAPVGSKVFLGQNETCFIYGNTYQQVIDNENKQRGVNKTLNFTSTILPGNSNFNEETNKYENALYEITVYYADFDISQFVEAPNNIPNNWDSFVFASENDPTVYIEDENNPLGYFSFKSKTAVLNSNASTISSDNTWRVRTSTYGSNSGLIHEGIARFFRYGNTNYSYNDPPDNRSLYNMVLEQSGSLWGTFENEGGTVYGYGRYDN